MSLFDVLARVMNLGGGGEPPPSAPNTVLGVVSDILKRMRIDPYDVGTASKRGPVPPMRDIWSGAPGQIPGAMPPMPGMPAPPTQDVLDIYSGMPGQIPGAAPWDTGPPRLVPNPGGPSNSWSLPVDEVNKMTPAQRDALEAARTPVSPSYPPRPESIATADPKYYEAIYGSPYQVGQPDAIPYNPPPATGAEAARIVADAAQPASFTRPPETPADPRADSTSSVRDLLMPLLMKMIKGDEDPIQRLNDIGSAGFTSLGTGTPYARNLAAMDAEKQQKSQGLLQTLSTIMGHEERTAQLNQQAKQFEVTSDLQRQTLAETVRRGDQTAVRDDRRDALERDRLAATELQRQQKERLDEQKRAEADHDAERKMTRTTLDTPEQQKFDSELSKNPEYLAARRNQDWPKATQIATDLAAKLGPKSSLTGDLKAREVSYVNTMDAARELRDLYRNGTPGALNPDDRVKVRQLWSNLVLQYAQATGRGANFTEMERELVNDILGQNPNSLYYRGLTSTDSFLKRLEWFQGTLDRQRQNLVGVTKRDESVAPRNAPSAPPETVPPGYRPTGKTMPDGRPIYVTPDGQEVAPPKR